jgi:hypothetical protein
MKLNIPELGTLLVLSQEWTFNLFGEGRNDALLEAEGLNPAEADWRSSLADARIAREANLKNGWQKETHKEYEGNNQWYKSVTLPKGSELTIDRIYIRKGSSDFSSVSFNLKRASVNKDFSRFANRIATSKGRCRFWAKLTDVNKIDFVDIGV